MQYNIFDIDITDFRSGLRNNSIGTMKLIKNPLAALRHYYSKASTTTAVVVILPKQFPPERVASQSSAICSAIGRCLREI